MEFRRQTLDNGLEVIAEISPKAYSTALGFFVNAGSRDETDEISGVSHFLEHMVFKGTPTRSAEDVNRELDEIGSQSNAFTSEEHTVYYARVLPENQSRATDLLSDIMRPSLRDEDFDMEKQVIIEEIAKYEDQPPFGAFEKCMAAHFGDHPLGRSVLGTAETVGALTSQQMRAYFEQRYSPGNIVLVASGNVDFDQLVADAERNCGSWTPFKVSREQARAAEHSGLSVIQKETAAQEYVVQIANGPAADDEDRYPARLMATIIGDDTGSRLFWELIDTGRAEFASISPYEFQGTGIFMTYLACMPEDTAECLEQIRRVFEESQRNGLTEDELLRAKSKICSDLVRHNESPARRLFSVGNNWLQRTAYKTVRETVDSYERVTLDEVNAALAKYPLTVSTIVAVGPSSDIAT
ncbi:MAG: insulinase family protein [Planctomycetaceae bacterium]|nr:insulinase family protein [Planctomycetales bacterium]MCB9872984.1 insulinase family protein [Planctomycetaceae bacterium]MCB9937573.1 insulinase family protein [Planctomycetaceae bacterium]